MSEPNWSRPVYRGRDSLYCAVTGRVNGHWLTACGSSWRCANPSEVTYRVAAADQCGRCAVAMFGGGVRLEVVP